jgi:hypothetical protein
MKESGQSGSTITSVLEFRLDLGLRLEMPSTGEKISLSLPNGFQQKSCLSSTRVKRPCRFAYNRQNRTIRQGDPF